MDRLASIIIVEQMFLSQRSARPRSEDIHVRDTCGVHIKYATHTRKHRRQRAQVPADLCTRRSTTAARMSSKCFAPACEYVPSGMRQVR